MKNTAVNPSAYQHILSMIHPEVSVVGLRVKNRFLEATLDKGVKFKVLNKSTD